MRENRTPGPGTLVMMFFATVTFWVVVFAGVVL